MLLATLSPTLIQLECQESGITDFDPFHHNVLSLFTHKQDINSAAGQGQADSREDARCDCRTSVRGARGTRDVLNDLTEDP